MTSTLFRCALLALPLVLTACDSTDDGGSVDAGASIYATSNPADLSGDSVVRLSSDLSASNATFGGITGVTSVQSVALADGTGYLTVDLAGALGGIVVVDNLCEGDDCTNGDFSTGFSIGAGSRTISGVLTGLVAPKGIINVDDRLIVADNGGAGAIRVFSETATGNAAPLFVVTDITGATNVWDVAYDDGDDRLFVAGTNGVVLVYDDFTERGANATPTRTITPSDSAGVKISANLHGIAYDEGRDMLVLSDVGAATTLTQAGFNTDGQLFTIAGATSATGNVAVRTRVSGTATTLGNPVDLALARNGSVYVAEKANSRVLRYDGLLTATTAVTTAPNASVAVTAAESVTSVT